MLALYLVQFDPIILRNDASCHFVCLHQDAGMIASGSTFGPHLWRVIETLFCMLHALVYSDYPRDAVQPTCIWL